MRCLVAKSFLPVVMVTTLLAGGCVTRDEVLRAQDAAVAARMQADQAIAAAQAADQKADQANAAARAAQDAANSASAAARDASVRNELPPPPPGRPPRRLARGERG